MLINRAAFFNQMKILPRTIRGKRALKILLFFLACAAFLHIMALTGQEGGDTFLDNLWLGIPGILAIVSGIAMFVASIIAIIKKERALLVFMAAFIGLLITLLLLGEFLGPAH